MLARYQNSYYQGEAALTEHPFGKGRVLHLGAAFNRETVRQLLAYIDVLEPYCQYVDVPEELELVVREVKGKYYLMLLNYQSYAVSFTLKQDVFSLLTDEALTAGTYTLPAYGVAVYEI